MSMVSLSNHIVEGPNHQAEEIPQSSRKFFYNTAIMRRLYSTLFLLAAGFLLAGCSAAVQISSLSLYNGPVSEKTNECQVVHTSLESKFKDLLKENNSFLLGDSHVQTLYAYEDIEAAYDCMNVGAKSVMVLDKGVIASSTAIASNNSVSIGEQNNTAMYVLAFFKKRIPYNGLIYTEEYYQSWKKDANIKYCTGCQ